MLKELAIKIKDSIVKASDNKILSYSVERIDDGEPINGFHEWVDSKDLVAAFLVKNEMGMAYYLLLIDWQERNNFYLVIYPQDKSGPLAEIHKTEEISGVINLYWRYQPTKRDGKNQERKNYFNKYFLTTEVRIEIPNSEVDVESFLDEVFSLTNNRIKADELSVTPPQSRIGFPEGRTYERMHKQRERNQKVIDIAKKQALQKYGKLQCEVCKFDFYDSYGEIGYGFIEAHHTVPVSQLTSEVLTSVEDIALVCSNCHSMLHRKRPWLDIAKLKEIYLNK